MSYAENSIDNMKELKKWQPCIGNNSKKYKNKQCNIGIILPLVFFSYCANWLCSIFIKKCCNFSIIVKANATRIWTSSTFWQFFWPMYLNLMKDNPSTMRRYTLCMHAMSTKTSVMIPTPFYSTSTCWLFNVSMQMQLGPLQGEKLP